VPRQRQHFRRHWYRAAIPGAFAVASFGLFAYRVPDGIWVAIPLLCLSLLFCALLHGGLIISSEGIEWYILRPKWRYRAIPWQAVLDVRKTRLGLHPLRLIVQHGRYELWLWGAPQPDRQMDIEIWPNAYSGGEAIWDAIQHFWSSRDRVAGVAAVNEQVAEPGAAPDPAG